MPLLNPFTVVLGVFLVVMMAKAILMIPENHRGAVVRLGKYLKTLGPGLHVRVPFIDLVTTVDLDGSIPGWPGLSERELEAAVESLVNLGKVIRDKGAAHQPRASRQSSPSPGASEAQKLAAWLVETASHQLGIDLSNDPLARDRLAASARAAVEEVRGPAARCDIHLPFLTADKSGPRHFEFSLTRSKLDEILGSP